MDIQLQHTTEPDGSITIRGRSGAGFNTSSCEHTVSAELLHLAVDRVEMLNVARLFVCDELIRAKYK